MSKHHPNVQRLRDAAVSPVSPFQLRRKAVRLAVLGALFSGSAALSFVPAAAHAQAAQSFNIPPGPLGAALSEFAAAAGVTLSSDAAQTRGLQSQGLVGQYSVAAGFAKLLSGSGLEAVQQGNGSYTLRRLPAASTVLPEVKVSANQENAWGPANGYIAKRSATGTKTDTALADTPYSVSVVTREQIDQQVVQKVEQAVRYEAGVRAELADDLRHQNVQIRGFNIGSANQGIYLDGLPLVTRYYGSYDINPYGLERIEVLRGPASMLYGQNPAGGILNLVSKRPTFDQLREVELTIGDPKRAQLAFDFGGAIGDDGKWAYRLSGLTRDGDTQVDYAKDKRSVLAPALTYRPDNMTSLTLLGNFQTIRAGSTDQWLPSVGTVKPTPYGRIPTSFFSGEPGYDRYNKDHSMVGYAFEHRFNDATSFRQNTRYSEIKTDYQALISELGWAAGPGGAPDYHALQRYNFASMEKARTFAIDNQLQHKIDSGLLQQTLLLGLDYQRSTFDTQLAFAMGVPNIDPFNPVYGNPVSRPANYADSEQTMEQTGIYLQDQIKLDQWIFNLGGRFDAVRTETFNRMANTNTANNDSEFTWRAGAMYQFKNGLSPYVSYSTSFRPQAGADFYGKAFVPTTGDQAEVGVKYQPTGSNSHITAAIFDLVQQNVPTRDPDPLHAGAQIQKGEIRSRGLELQAKSALTRNLSVLASYTYTDMEITESNNGDVGRSPFAGTPRHMASAWADYAFSQSALSGLRVAGGVRYIGTTTDDAFGVTEVSPFTLADASLQYDLGRASPALKGITADLRVSNLFDKTYVASCYNANLCFYGPRRTTLLSIRYRW